MPCCRQMVKSALFNPRIEDARVLCHRRGPYMVAGPQRRPPARCVVSVLWAELNVIGSSTLQSTDSLSTVTSLATPSLSRTSSPGEDHRPPPTPPDASSLSFFQPTEIPVEQIHLHVGSFYYPPSSIPTSFPYKRGSLSNSSSTSLASMSSTLSRKLRFGSDKLWLKVKPVPAALLPRREIGPAISIAPPDLPPAEVFRPSIHRLTSRHMNSSLSRHPLARKNVSAASSTSKPSPSSAMLNPSTSPTRLLSHVKTRARRTLYPDLQTKPLPMKTASREGGLIMPDPLRPEEIEGTYLPFTKFLSRALMNVTRCFTYNQMAVYLSRGRHAASTVRARKRLCTRKPLRKLRRNDFSKRTCTATGLPSWAFRLFCVSRTTLAHVSTFEHSRIVLDGHLPPVVLGGLLSHVEP